MVLVLPAFSFCKRLKAFLLCLILCGIRTPACPGQTARINTAFRLLDRLAHTFKRLLFQVRRRLFSMASPPACTAKAGADSPYNLLCSSIPFEFPLPNHVETSASDSISGHQGKPTASCVQGTPAELNVKQLSTAIPLQFQSHVEPSFALCPPVRAVLPSGLLVLNAPKEPFSKIHPIATAQLIPARGPIVRDEPSVIDEIYHRPQMIPEKAAQGYIPSYTSDYTPDVDIPGWKILLRPQGTMYFHREEKNVLTNANLFDNENFRVVEETINRLFLKIEHDGVDVPPDIQLVVDISWKKLTVGYYFASLQRRCLFWAHEKYVEKLFKRKRVPNVRSYMHIGHVIEAEFWHHYYLFPHAQTLSPQLVREVKGLLSFMAAERVFNEETTLECSTKEIDTASAIINSIPVEVIENEGDPCLEAAYYHSFVGYIMALHALHKFDNRHGQPNARCSRGEKFFDDADLRPLVTLFSRLIFRLMSPVLFYTPETYLDSLETIISDGDVFLEAWRSFVIELHQEWNGLVIFATVLLATNVAFLAIPSLDSGDHPGRRSAAQICSYLSIVLSIGSIALGQLFSRYHRIKGLEHLDERIRNNFDLLLDIGCSKLAIMYSLPYAMLSWSVIAFLVAFLIMCFDGTTRVVRCLLGVASAVLVLVIIYCVYTIRSNDEERSADSFLTRFNQKLRKMYSLCRNTDPDSTELQIHPLSRPRPVVQLPDV